MVTNRFSLAGEVFNLLVQKGTIGTTTLNFITIRNTIVNKRGSVPPAPNAPILAKAKPYSSITTTIKIPLHPYSRYREGKQASPTS